MTQEEINTKYGQTVAIYGDILIRKELLTKDELAIKAVLMDLQAKGQALAESTKKQEPVMAIVEQ